ncbi:MAG: HNH endonuclease [Lachnospiraceae bacterium]|nr:HNH endonuclease [Lachnospiraceae bacterium]
MAERNGIRWTREETILAFDLYCRTPFSKISQSNKEIIQLAQLLGRTPGSVGLKMQNLAHYDPCLRERNVTAMAHASKLDRQIWEEFEHNWEELSYSAQKILATRKSARIEEVVKMNIDEIPSGEYREQVMKKRVGQYFFRMAVLNSYNYSCCITGIKKPELLIASHIKPWRNSDAGTERANPSNGLCLNAFHDKAFDKGFITLDSQYRIVISNYLLDANMDDDTKRWIIGYKNKRIILPERFKPGKIFIEYHNDKVFLR